MARISWIRRDDPDQTLVAKDLSCEIDEEKRRIVLSVGEAPELEIGYLVSSGDLRDAATVEDFGELIDAEGHSRVWVSYRLIRGV